MHAHIGIVGYVRQNSLFQFAVHTHAVNICVEHEFQECESLRIENMFQVN